MSGGCCLFANLFRIYQCRRIKSRIKKRRKQLSALKRDMEYRIDILIKKNAKSIEQIMQLCRNTRSRPFTEDVTLRDPILTPIIASFQNATYRQLRIKCVLKRIGVLANELQETYLSMEMTLAFHMALIELKEINQDIQLSNLNDMIQTIESDYCTIKKIKARPMKLKKNSSESKHELELVAINSNSTITGIEECKEHQDGFSIDDVIDIQLQDDVEFELEEEQRFP